MTPSDSLPDSALHADILAIERGCGGQIGLAMRDLQTGETIAYHADRNARTASVIKFPILVHVALAVREGALAWNEPLTLTDADKVAGSGVLTALSEGLTITLRDACTLMTIVSDNTATNLVIEYVSVDAINARMRALGLPRTTLFRKVFASGPPISPANARYGLGVTTPREMLRLLTELAQGTLGDAATSADILGILSAQQLLNNISRLLPSDWKYAGKTGSLDHVRNDVGLVTAPDGRRFALALFCQNLPDILWTADNPGHLALAHLARRLLLGI